MSTALTRMAMTFTKIGFKRDHQKAINFKVQSTNVNLYNSYKCSYNARMFSKNSKNDNDNNEASDKTTNSKSACADFCEMDEDAEAIAAHVGPRCEKHPCDTVKDPYIQFIKLHISGRKTQSKQIEDGN